MVPNIKLRREHRKKVVRGVRAVVDRSTDNRVEGAIATRNPPTNTPKAARVAVRGAVIIAENPTNQQATHRHRERLWRLANGYLAQTRFHNARIVTAVSTRMKTQLSILIPTYNYVCLPLVRELHRQASEMGSLEFEIVVAEDGSDQPDDIARNAEITALSHCKHIVREENVGRAVIRNHLADMANMPWLLFIDSDMRVVSPHFVERYLQTPDEWGVVYGGNTTNGGAWNDERLLKVRYEQVAERQFTPQQRAKRPNQNLNTSNIFVSKRVMQAVPFDSRFLTYGYEDVFWGMSLAQKGIEVAHINNPIGFNHYDSNVVFVGKTIEGLHTLYTFRAELADFSPIIRLERRLRRWRLDGAVRSVLNKLMPLLHRRIIGFKPSLVAFKLFKLCTYLHIAHTDTASKA